MRGCFLRPLFLFCAFVAMDCGEGAGAPATAVDEGGVQPEAGDPEAAPPIAAQCPRGGVPTDPVSYGACAVDEAKVAAKSSAKVSVVVVSAAGAQAALASAHVALSAQSESYAIVTSADTTLVVGRDAVGAMYGALDVAERLTMQGASALPVAAPVTASPSIALRAANPFLVLPADHEASWWFRDPSFWETYLDMMARARLDFLDMHGMYNLDNTVFPNVLLWFSTSASFPDVGISRADRDTNLAMLDQIVKAAAIRGIHVGLMNYNTDTSPLGDGTGPTLSATDLATYTREATLHLSRGVPGLWYYGFRVGESGEPASWYESTVIAGLAAAGTGTHVSTRTWLTPKSELLPLAMQTGPETIIEAKYNGEQFGAPYVISGGRTTGWDSYFYQDYLDPPTPYRFVFQIRSGGTHRIFRFASYDRARRATGAVAMSPRVDGFTFEAAHAYLPQRDFYHANPEDSFSPWTFRRDELAYLLMGRLAYDPGTPEAVFRAALSERVGTDGLWDAVQAASDIVPSLLTAQDCGPDQRDDAPELELGGTVAYWASASNATPPQYACGTKGHGPFDTFAVAAPLDAATDLVAGRGTTRLSPVDLAAAVLADVAAARNASQVSIDPTNAEARDVVRECNALADLGEWFAHKLRAATALAVYALTAKADWLAAAREESAASVAAYRKLASDTAYIAPFDDLLRMQALGLVPFHWKEQVPRLALDASSIDAVAAAVAASPPRFSGTMPKPSAWLDAPRVAGPGLESLSLGPATLAAKRWTFSVTFTKAVALGAQVNLLTRPFDSDAADWSATPMSGSGTSFQVTLPALPGGVLYAVEVTGGPGRGYRYPDVTEETPYRVLAP